jgi:membrane-associated protease RseP (regulator of RpoE activity)
VSTDFTPPNAPLPSPPFPEPPGPPAGLYWSAAPRPKFRHPYTRHLLFFLLTVFTTSFTPAWLALSAGLNPLPLFTWEVFRAGLWYSIPVLTILSAHEFGHYFACRYHNVDATLPYFIPAPLPLTGTLGAVIRIREAFPSKRALFDIGVAGPLAGFVALLPFLYWGMTRSTLTPLPTDGGALYFGEPLLWKLFQWLHFGRLAAGMEVAIDQVGFAAWWGMLATALNLLPFGQLDGGHIMYANVGRRATRLSFATLVLVLGLAFRSASWFSMAAMMMVMAVFFGFRHPRIVDEHEPLDPIRRAVSIAAVIVFILCFTPVPIDIIGR